MALWHGGIPLKMTWPKGLSRKEYFKTHTMKVKVDDGEVKHRGRKSTKSDEERFCPQTIRSHGMFGCKVKNDGKLYPSACTITNYTGGCRIGGTKRTRKVKEVAE